MPPPILLVNGSDTIEGDTRVFLNAAAELAHGGHRCTFFSAPGAAAEAARGIAGVDVRIAAGLLAQNADPRRGLRGLVDGVARAARFSAAVVTIVHEARRQRGAIVYTYDRTRGAPAAYLAARLARRPFVWHANLSIAYNGGRLRRYIAFHADRIIAVSRYVAEQYRQAGCPAQALRVVLNGVPAPPNIDAAAGERLRASLGIAPRAPVIGMVGRLSPWKGQEDLLRATPILRERFPDLQVLIAGHDTDESRWTHGPHETSFLAVLERERARLGLESCVRFLGPVSPPTPVYMAADVVALPSHEEPFGLVVIEAMLLGRPVVTCRAGGIPEIVAEGTAVLVEPRAPEALARALGDLLADREGAARVAAAGRSHALARFSRERFGDDLRAAFAEIAGRYSRAVGSQDDGRETSARA